VKRHIAVALALILAGAALTAGQAPRGFQPEDIYALKDVGDAQISPDGARVVFTVSEVTADRARAVSHLWLVSTSGGAARQLTTGEAGASTPRWSPDGRWIAFYSAREGNNGLWVMSADGGEPRLLAPVRRTNFHLKGAGESFTWSPDSRRLAFLSAPESASETLAITPAPNASAALADINDRVRRPLTREEIERLPPIVRDRILQAQGQAAPTAAAPRPAAGSGSLSAADDPRVITRLQYKSRTAFSDQLPSHIFIAELETGQMRQLTFGRHYEHSINWSPRGEEIVFVSNHEPDPDAVNNTDIFAVNVESRLVRQLTRTKGCEWMPVFSPDGGEIAYAATKREITTIDSVAEDAHVYSIPAQGGLPRELNGAQDRRANLVRWAADGKTVLFTASDQGKTLIYRVDKTGQVTNLFDRAAQVTSFSVARNGALALTLSDATHPAEVYLLTSGGELKQLSEVNRALLATPRLSPPREFRFKHEGLEIQGWLVPPLNADEGKKYPVVLSIHGGPHGMYGYSFNATAQTLAGRGYGVLLINPRGSSGYGQQFSDGCVNDWGGGDYRDLMKGVDEALARFPYLDKNRMGVMGGSYGGYMTNWVVTQTDRFKAAVASASLANLISFYGTSLYQDLIHAEFNGFPWEGDNFEKLWERSPLKHIKNAKTPLLLIHGELDNDVHITQAEEMYTALRRRGVEAVFVRYPGEGHGFREPRHRHDQLVRTLDWFGQRLK
jgi:dipeptidyl aminopeptidase/acylaminoacyl peptidase